VARVFLFDVDGTLVIARGAGRRALGVALAQTFGCTGPIHTYDFRGKTDPRIVHDLMRAAGVPGDAIVERLDDCLATYARALEGLIRDGHRVDVLPGVAELVRRLDARTDAIVGLLTGNIEAGARLKLAPTGLLPYFRVGAYGSDDPDRARLPRVAAARVARVTGQPVSLRDLVIIGDTPLDVDCARACGAVAVAVATGQYGYEQLAACGPDLVFRDFSDVDAVLVGLLP
jgi:phosphoglycolate phosphatase-like HAD superfamily hydrolase